MIAVDASALVAIGDLEPDGDVFTAALASATSAIISPINAAEAGLILIGRGRLESVVALSVWMSELSLEVSNDSASHEDVLIAYLTFGKRYHPAKLNLGDCFAYALAKRLDVPLLYKGEDFAKTDIRSALQPT
ncbi:MAG TPA: type II toxin-antitoxin system VapC family toxin [Phenylobacterium sp.]|nr:type II toxin-antitoxin system VapC family toxin [Phenylobacterium sp.]